VGYFHKFPSDGPDGLQVPNGVEMPLLFFFCFFDRQNITLGGSAAHGAEEVKSGLPAWSVCNKAARLDLSTKGQQRGGRRWECKQRCICQ
jgi:hypothetical protein